MQRPVRKQYVKFKGELRRSSRREGKKNSLLEIFWIKGLKGIREWSIALCWERVAGNVTAFIRTKRSGDDKKLRLGSKRRARVLSRRKPSSEENGNSRELQR